MSEAWACAYQPGVVHVPPTLHDTEADAQAEAERLTRAGIRNPVVYRINLED